VEFGNLPEVSVINLGGSMRFTVKMTREWLPYLRALRLALSGGIVGASLFGFLFPSLSGNHVTPDVIGAGVGFSAALLAVKLAHLV
jgi:hypothetical protein